jgi:arginase family protein
MGTSTSSQPPVPSVRGEPAAAETDRGRTGTVPPGGEPPEFLASLRSMYGPEVRFLGCPPVDLRDAESVAQCDVVIIGAPFDSGTSYRSGARFGPQAIRAADYNPHIPVRPSLALGIDPFEVLTIADAGDILMPPAQFELSLARLEDAVAIVVERDAIPVVLGGDHSIASPMCAAWHGGSASARSRSSTSTRTATASIPSSARCTGTAHPCADFWNAGRRGATDFSRLACAATGLTATIKPG